MIAQRTWRLQYRHHDIQAIVLQHCLLMCVSKYHPDQSFELTH